MLCFGMNIESRKEDEILKSITFDYSKLRGRMVEKGYTQEKLANRLGITVQALSKKINGKMRFSTDDIYAIVGVLDIKPEELGAYFFTPTV